MCVCVWRPCTTPASLPLFSHQLLQEPERERESSPYPAQGCTLSALFLLLFESIIAVLLPPPPLSYCAARGFVLWKPLALNRRLQVWYLLLQRGLFEGGSIHISSGSVDALVEREREREGGLDALVYVFGNS